MTLYYNVLLYYNMMLYYNIMFYLSLLILDKNLSHYYKENKVFLKFNQILI